MGRNVLAGRNQWSLAGRLAVLADKLLATTGFIRMFRQDYVCINLFVLEFNRTAFDFDSGFTPTPMRLEGAESPRPWQWNFQTPASAQMEGIVDLYSDVMAILIAVGVLVAYLLVVGLAF